MADFIFDEEALQEVCSVYEKIPGRSWPLDIPANPYITSNREFLDRFGSQLVSDPDLVESITSALFSLYLGADEIGIFGLEFENENSALKAAEIMKSDYTDKHRFKLFHKGNIIIHLWQNTADDPCLEILQQQIENLLQ